MKSTHCGIAALILAFCGAPSFARQDAVRPATGIATPQPRTEAMRLTTNSEKARSSFGEAVTLSGNYRLDECIRTLRAAVGEDPNFAAGWSLLAYFATDSHESADALALCQTGAPQ